MAFAWPQTMLSYDKGIIVWPQNFCFFVIPFESTYNDIFGQPLLGALDAIPLSKEIKLFYISYIQIVNNMATYLKFFHVMILLTFLIFNTIEVGGGKPFFLSFLYHLNYTYCLYKVIYQFILKFIIIYYFYYRT